MCFRSVHGVCVCVCVCVCDKLHGVRQGMTVGCNAALL